MSINSSTPAERIAYYRKQAEDALRRLDSTTDPAMRESLLRIAASWHGLASEIERHESAPIPDVAAAKAPEPPARN